MTAPEPSPEPRAPTVLRATVGAAGSVVGWTALVFGAGTAVNWAALTLVVLSPAPGTGWLRRALDMSGDAVAILVLGVGAPAAYLFAGWFLGVRRGLLHLYRTKRELVRAGVAAMLRRRGATRAAAATQRVPLVVRLLVRVAARRARLPESVSAAAGGVGADTRLSVGGLAGGLLDGLVEEHLLGGASMPLRAVAVANLVALALAILLV